MYRNNKGSTALILSVVFGLIALAVAGYFGYSMYQEKLAKERIAKLEKVNEAIDDATKKFNIVIETQSKDGYGDEDFKKFKRDIQNLDDSLRTLSKLEQEKDIKDEVKKCTEDIKGIMQAAQEVTIVGDKKISGKQITSVDVQNIDTNNKKIFDYVGLRNCKKASEKVDEVISKLQK